MRNTFNKRGIALFITLALLFLLSVSAIVVLLMAYNYANVTQNQMNRSKAILYAESGIHYAYWKIRINEDDAGDPMTDYFPGTCTLTPSMTLPTGWSVEVDVTDDGTGNPKSLQARVEY